MTRLGHESEVCSDGTAAWQRLLEESFDAVIVDWVMPEMDGVTLCKKIREHDFDHYVYLILCTSKEEHSDLIEGMESGADDFTVMPPRYDEFVVRMRAAERISLLQKRLHQQNRELKRQHEDLAAAYESMKRDLKAAATSLERLLPSGEADNETVTTRFIFKPSSFLGGDFLNYFPLGPKHLALYVVDVSGHGIPAALKAVTLGRLLNEGSDLLLYQGRPRKPSKVASRLNYLFLEDDDYFTLLYGVLDLESLKLTYVQAGHPSPLLVRDAKPEYLGDGGFPVSLLDDAEFEDRVVQLRKGDRLYLYSDGLTEAEKEAEAFGEARFASALLKRSEEPLQESLDGLMEEVSQWCVGEWSDDLSVLALEI